MKACARMPSRATTTSVTARRSPAFASARVEIGDDEGVVTLGRARERDRVALLEAADGGSDETPCVSAERVERFVSRPAQASEERRVGNSRGDRLAADDPGQHLRVGDVEQTLELGDLVVAHGRQIRVGELAHDEIHLAHAAAPGAKQNPPPALVERCAGEGRSRT